MFGKCQSCDAHMAHIESLKAQIEMLTKLALPHTTVTQQNYTESLEADKLLSGNYSEPTYQESTRDISVDELLSGTYGNDQTDTF